MLRMKCSPRATSSVNKWRAVAALAVQISVVSVRAAGEAEPEDSGGEVSSSALRRLWEDQRASGQWRTDYFHSSKTLDDRAGFMGATVQLKMLPSAGEKIDGKLEVRATNTAIGDGAHTHTRVLEAYGSYHFAKADLHIGKQIVAWGRADGINPTDNLTPRDYTVMLPFEDDQRFGTPAVKLDAFVSQDHTLTFYATPFFNAAVVPVPAAGREVIEKKPAHTLANTAFGIKLNKVGEGWDWSVSYYNGFSLQPDTRLIDIGAAATALELHYDRMRSFGADVARSYGRFGFRGEMAYIDTADDTGADPTIRNPSLYWVAGVDRTFFANLNLNLQFFQRRVRHFRDPESFTDPGQRIAASQNAVIDVHPERVNNGISFRISNKWLHDTLEAEILSVINITRNNSYFRPFVTYAFNDEWKITVGGELFSGDPDTQYGSIKSNQGAFLELRYGF